MRLAGGGRAEGGGGPSLPLAILRVAALYFAILLTGAAIFKFLPGEWVEPLNEALAWCVQKALLPFGVEARRMGAALVVPLPDGKPLVACMVRHCLGVHSLLGYLALVFALPAVPVCRRLKWALAGIAILSAANVMRTATTIWAGARFGIRAFDLLHLTVWRVGLSLLALAMALLFALSIGRGRESLFIPPKEEEVSRSAGGSSPSRKPT